MSVEELYETLENIGRSIESVEVRQKAIWIVLDAIMKREYNIEIGDCPEDYGRLDLWLIQWEN